MHFRTNGTQVRRTVIALAVICAAGLAACRKSESTAATPTAPATAASTAAATAAAEKPVPDKAAPSTPAAKPVPEAVKKLMGRWLRSDGGYVLELKNADITGVVQASYFNPKPINVSRAIWMQGAQGLQIMVELNDVGYPGATYVLSHDAESDRLVGQYNQPAMQQSFDIEFIRQANPLAPNR